MRLFRRGSTPPCIVKRFLTAGAFEVPTAGISRVEVGVHVLLLFLKVVTFLHSFHKKNFYVVIRVNHTMRK